MVQILAFLFNAYGVGMLVVGIGISGRIIRRCVNREVTVAQHDEAVIRDFVRMLLWPKYLWRPWWCP